MPQSHYRARLSHDFKIGRSDPILSPIVPSSDPIFRPNTNKIGQIRSFENGHLTFAKESFGYSHQIFQGLIFPELTMAEQLNP